MRAILLTMVICFFFALYGGVIGGFIFLSGLIVGCTLYLAEIIKERKASDSTGKEKRQLVLKRPINQEGGLKDRKKVNASKHK